MSFQHFYNSLIHWLHHYSSILRKKLYFYFRQYDVIMISCNIKKQKKAPFSFIISLLKSYHHFSIKVVDILNVFWDLQVTRSLSMFTSLNYCGFFYFPITYDFSKLPPKLAHSKTVACSLKVLPPRNSLSLFA